MNHQEFEEKLIASKILLYDEWEFEDDKEEQIIKTYQSKLESLNAMDFGDLILKFYELLQLIKILKKEFKNYLNMSL